MTLALGPEVDPARHWADAALVTTSPSINPDYPTTEPRLRDGADGARRGARRRRRQRAGPRVRARPLPAPVRGPDDRGDRHEGQDHDRVADRGDPRRRPGPSGRPRRQHRHPDRRAARRAHGRPPRRLRAVRAAAADPVAGNDRGRLHERDVRPPGPARLARGVPGGQAAAGRAGRARRGARAQRRGPGRRGLRGPRHRRTAVLYRRDRPLPGGARRRRWLDRGGRRGAAAAGRRWRRRRPGRTDGSCRSPSWPCPGAHNVSNALAAVAVGLLFGVEPDAIREAAAAFDGRRAPARSRSRSSMACAS